MKYIDADKLIAKIEKLSADDYPIEYERIEKLAYNRALSEVEDAITYLQHEQSEISETEVVESKATINGIKTKLNTIIFIVSDDLKPGDKVEAIIARKEESK